MLVYTPTHFAPLFLLPIPYSRVVSTASQSHVKIMSYFNSAILTQFSESKKLIDTNGNIYAQIKL